MRLNLPPKSTGTVSAAQYNQLLACVEQLALAVSGQLKVGPGLQMQQGASDTVLSVSPGLIGDVSFWAEITGATADGDRWKYSWQEVEKAGDGYADWDVPGGGLGRTGSANAYNGDELATDDYDAVPTGTIVRLRRVAKAEGMSAEEYWFHSNEDTGGTGTATVPQPIFLSPEYAGAVVMPTNAEADTGTMCGWWDSTGHHNCYKWTTEESTAQEYGVVVRVQVPMGWTAWAATCRAYGICSAAAGAGTTVQLTSILDTSNTERLGSAVTIAANTDATWQEETITMPAGTYTPGGLVTFTFRLAAISNSIAYLGELILDWS